mmetsp:Transcript_40843/g.94029  ORF Transcript_40843/g.94029 Transcript_40843/m.94029 type:complete len:276 (+) Transcript_40843:320-1147(+)
MYLPERARLRHLEHCRQGAEQGNELLLHWRLVESGVPFLVLWHWGCWLGRRSLGVLVGHRRCQLGSDLRPLLDWRQASRPGDRLARGPAGVRNRLRGGAGLRPHHVSDGCSARPLEMGNGRRHRNGLGGLDGAHRWWVLVVAHAPPPTLARGRCGHDGQRNLGGLLEPLDGELSPKRVRGAANDAPSPNEYVGVGRHARGARHAHDGMGPARAHSNSARRGPRVGRVCRGHGTGGRRSVDGATRGVRNWRGPEPLDTTFGRVLAHELALYCKGWG